MTTHYITNDIVIEVEKGKLEFEVALYDLNATTDEPAAEATSKDLLKAIGQVVVDHIDSHNKGKSLKGEIAMYERLSR